MNNFIDQAFCFVTVALSAKLISYSKEQFEFMIFLVVSISFWGFWVLVKSVTVIKQPISKNYVLIYFFFVVKFYFFSCCVGVVRCRSNSFDLANTCAKFERDL